MTYVLADMDTFASQDPSPLDILLAKEEISLDNPEIGDIIEGKVFAFDVTIEWMCNTITMIVETKQGNIDITRFASDDEVRALEVADVMGKECDLIFTREGWAFNNLYLD